jgi:hypothetical protein
MGILNSQEKSMEKISNREDLFLLKPYTRYIDVISEFGEPDNVAGRGFVIIQYYLTDGRKVELNFGRGDRLYAIREISIKGEFKEIFNCFTNP